VNGGVDNWGGEEKLPNECNMGSPSAPERHVRVEESDVVLDVVAFGSCSAEPVGKVNATFSVDMSKEAVSPEGVQLVIKGPWIWTALTDMGDGIWETTLLLNQNSTYPYTFVNGAQDDWAGEESVPEECNFGTSSAPERRLVLAENDTVLETVSFGACAVTSDVSVTFRVDMKDQTVSGDGVQLVIKEPWIWTAMTESAEGIWEATVVLPGNTTYPYSFVNGAQDYWAGEEIIQGECKDGENNQRLAQIGGEDITLEAFVFGGCAERPSGISRYDAGTISVYPNPADGYLFIEAREFPMHSLAIIDRTGRTILERRVAGLRQASLDVNQYPAGFYILVVRGKESVAFSRFTINR
jgi:hypothetical protein